LPIFVRMSESTEHTPRHKRELTLWQLIPLIVIVLLMVFPLFIIIYNHVPPFHFPGTDLRIDHVLTFIIVFLSVYYLARRIRHMLFLCFATGIFTMIVLSFIGRYSFGEVIKDYRSFLYSINQSAIRFEFEEEVDPDDMIFPKAGEFRNAVDYKNPLVRNYAAEIAVMHFERYATGNNLRVVQFFSIFKEIRKRWRYVFDPVDGDYFAKASETVMQLRSDGKFKGDCDDYSILMGACIKAVGGEVRLVRTQVDVGGMSMGHVYPEVLVGNQKDLENINYLVKEVLFVKESEGKPLFYHVDVNHKVWLNFDYNDHYPGGKYQSTIRIAELRI